MSEKKPSVFAGIRLTDQTAIARPGPDQRLFATPPREDETDEPAEPAPPKTRPARRPASTSTKQTVTNGTTIPSARDTTVPGQTPDVVARFRWAVRRPGKESATLRLTAEEKEALADVVYTYRRRGRRTSETELIRIAIHAALADYTTNGENSVLAQVLADTEP